jgi:hypothetical protein
MRSPLAPSILALLAGCAGATHVVSTGPDTYMIASHGVMGWSSGPALLPEAWQTDATHQQQRNRGRFRRDRVGRSRFSVRGVG